jgi:glycosyltransferase involved in cell wall biosynthesis
MTPEISVIMSVCDGEPHLRESVESILNQTFTDFEFIIVDDGSTDATWDILKDYAKRDERFVLVQNRENIGLTKSLNRGLKLAKGRYIARQDGDDVSLPQRLATQIEFLEKHEHVGLLGSTYHVTDEQGQTIATMHHPETDTGIRWQMLFHNAFCHTSVMLRRDLLNRANLLYDEDLTSCQDYELWSRMLQHIRAANLQTPLVAWRQSDKAISNTRRDEQQQIATEISAREINRLFKQTHFSLAEVAKLRSYYYALLQGPGKEQAHICRQFIEILSAFMKQPNLDSASVRQILRQWVGRILSSLLTAESWKTQMFGNLAVVLRMYASTTFMPLAGRAKLRSKQPKVQATDKG